MKQNVDEQAPQQNQRRAFFVRLFAAISGGIIGGSLLKNIVSSGSENRRTQQPIDVKVHPLAVPRTKEGS